MQDIIEEFNYRKGLIEDRNYKIASARIKGFLEWLEKTTETKIIINNIYQEPSENQEQEMIDSASTPEEIAVCGIFLMRLSANGNFLQDIATTYNIRPSFRTTDNQDLANEVFEQFIEPAMDFIERELEKNVEENEDILDEFFATEKQIYYPPEIHESLKRFHKDHPI